MYVFTQWPWVLSTCSLGSACIIWSAYIRGSTCILLRILGSVCIIRSTSILGSASILWSACILGCTCILPTAYILGSACMIWSSWIICSTCILGSVCLLRSTLFLTKGIVDSGLEKKRLRWLKKFKHAAGEGCEYEGTQHSKEKPNSKH
jgi:hypothetical protein